LLHELQIGDESLHFRIAPGCVAQTQRAPRGNCIHLVTFGDEDGLREAQTLPARYRLTQRLTTPRLVIGRRSEPIR